MPPPPHLVSRKVEDELLLGEERRAHALQAGQHGGPVVFGLVQHLLDRVDVGHPPLQLTQVTVHGVPVEEITGNSKVKVSAPGEGMGGGGSLFCWFDAPQRRRKVHH